jgi:hypothetical protein
MDIFLLSSLAIFIIIAFVIMAAWYIGRKKRVKDYKRLLFSTKDIKIDGFTFKIRKINVLDHLEGAKVMAETFSTYKTKKDFNTVNDTDIANLKKIKKYITDIICAGVIEPVFVREKALITAPNEILIDDLFSDWVLAQRLAQEIFDFTNGKKK